MQTVTDAEQQVTKFGYEMHDLGTLIYQYDDAGHRTTVGDTWARTGLPPAQSTWTYNAANQLITRDQTTVTYDDNGDLIQTSGQGTTVTYTWNARHQLVGISGGGITASFAYDGLGRRLTKTVNSVTTDFLYDGLNPVQELSGGSPVATLFTGLGIDEFISRTQGGTTSTFLTDALGSTVALTDGTGSVQTEYTYDPFGAVTVTGTSSTNAYQFTGRETDGTGLLYYRARYYSPVLQRFISEDPIGFAGGDPNLYAYVTSNPVNYSDPLGLVRFLIGGQTVQVDYSVSFLPVNVTWDIEGFSADNLSFSTNFPPATVGTGFEFKFNPPGSQEMYISPWVGLGRNASVGTNIVANGDGTFRIQGININVGWSRGYPVGAQISDALIWRRGGSGGNGSGGPGSGDSGGGNGAGRGK